MHQFPRVSEDSSITSDISYTGATLPRRNTREFGSRLSVSQLPSLPSVPTTTGESSISLDLGSPVEESKVLEYVPTPETSYVEFDLSNANSRKSTDNTPHERVITAKHRKNDSGGVQEVLAELQQEDDDFFNDKATNWQSMKKVSAFDYYNERGDLEFETDHRFDSLDNKPTSRGYTKIDTEEQLAKYSVLNRKTDFLFQIRAESKIEKQANYQMEDLEYISEDDLEFEDDNLDSAETLEGTKGMLTESQKFAYVGIVKLATVDMATSLARLRFKSSKSLAKKLSLSQRHFANWTMYIMTKLYDHMDLNADEKKMIENLSIHGLEVSDLTDSLLKLKGPKTKIEKETPGFDLSWVIVCDLFLLLLSDGYYDSRSRSLLIQFSEYLNISKVEIYQFERRLIESLELDTSNKTIENKDELLNDRLFIDKYIKKNKNKRLAYIGLATIGGSLAIGLSAGLLAPVIGAGLAAGLTTVGITGTSGFLAGVGGSAIITTGGIFAGAKVGSKAGARRVGDVHTFELKPLHNNKRTNLIITVSGWMNGQLDDVRLPFSTVDPVMGDMFSLLWEPEMLQSMGQTIGILASEALSTSIQQILGATILTALMSAIQLPMALSKLSYLLDNPWNVSLDRAWKAGKILADTLIAGNMGVRPITLVGFSLGSRLIYSCLIELATRGGFGLIENVIILGNPVTIKHDQISLARSVVSGRFINGYSTKDWILGYLFRATGGGIRAVAGLSPIDEIYGIENVDCTDLVEGHMAYRKVIPKILKMIEWEILSEEFAEIEEPDAGEGERTRKLLSEFEEARMKMARENTEVKKKTWKDWFRPKQKDWWDMYDGKGEEGESKKEDPSNDPMEEYDETALAPGPIFDVNALMEEVEGIEKLGDEDLEVLEQVRKNVDKPQPHHRLNEEEEEEAEEQKSVVDTIAAKLHLKGEEEK